MTDWFAFFNGEYCSRRELALPTDDLGFVQGVAVSERMRTFSGQLFRLHEHLARLANSLEIIGVMPDHSLEQIAEIAEELARRNHALLPPADDLGLSLFVTPGRSGSDRPTLGIDCYPLPFGQWVTYYTVGQALTETGVRQVPDSCWPPSLKCRSRMHYYLADRLAHQQDAGSRAVLLDQDGFVSEASTANLVFCRNDREIVSPPLHKILPGVSLSVLDELATTLELTVTYEDFLITDLEAASEILLCSTSPCVWPVTRLNSKPVGLGAQGPVFRRLLAAWGELVGLDIVAQAQQFCSRC
jgi:branched-subunit amino acid aminotransferase/4-amino-4-deoxychorismate lyase